jgi:hypothetical protein
LIINRFVFKSADDAIPFQKAWDPQLKRNLGNHIRMNPYYENSTQIHRYVRKITENLDVNKVRKLSIYDHYEWNIEYKMSYTPPVVAQYA